MKKKQNTLNCVEITGDTGIALGAIFAKWGLCEPNQEEETKGSGLWVLNSISNGVYNDYQLELKSKLDVLREGETLVVERWE